jgi:hypothetical protein
VIVGFALIPGAEQANAATRKDKGIGGISRAKI